MSWSFNGATFAVVAEGPVFNEWFPSTTVLDSKRILGSDSWVISIGASGYGGELQLTAQFTSQANRDALLAQQGKVATLADDVGRTCQALFADSTTIRVMTPDSGVVRLAVKFVYVSP